MNRIKSPYIIRTACSGFSLVEILTVIAVMSIVIALSIGSLPGNSQARSLTNAGNTIVDLTNQARQNSISQNVLTALAVVDKSGNSSWDGRLFILLQMGNNDTSWTPASKWQILPAGITIDTSQSQSFLTSPTLTTSIGSLTYMGTTIPSSEISCQVFMPDGRLLTNNGTTVTAPRLYLLPGQIQNSTMVYTDKGGASGNYYEITINPYTGTSIVDRP